MPNTGDLGVPAGMQIPFSCSRNDHFMAASASACLRMCCCNIFPIGEIIASILLEHLFLI